MIDQKGIRQNGFPPSSLVSFLLKLPYTLSWPSENYITVSNFNVFNFYKFHQESTSSKFKISYGLMGATYKNLFVRKTGNRNAKYGYIQYLPEVWKRAREAYVKSRFSPHSQKSGFSRRVLKFFLKVAIMVGYFLNFFTQHAQKQTETRCRSVLKSGYFAAL